MAETMDCQQRRIVMDESLFSEVYNRYWERLFQYVIRILPNADETADVVQETFISFWELQEKSNEIKSIKAYLFIMARNLAFKRLRERIKQQTEIDRLVDHYCDAETANEQALHTKALASLIDNAIDKLPEKMRAVFVLSRKEHLSYREISDRLNISDQTVKKQISNALKHLKLEIDDEYIPYLTLVSMIYLFT